MNRWMAAGLLGLPEVFSLQELKKAYAAEAKKHHPEDEPEYFRKLQEAYLCLKPYAKKVPAAPAETPMPTPAWEPEETEEETGAGPAGMPEGTGEKPGTAPEEETGAGPFGEPEDAEERQETASEENGETTPEEEPGAGPFGEPEDAEERQETASEENGETTPEEEPEAGAVRKPEDIGERQETAPEETGENAETAPEEEPEAGAVRKPEDIGERQETAPAGRPEEPAENPETAPEEETGPAGKPAGPDGGSEGTLPEGLDFERTIRAAEHRKKERELGISIALTQLEHGDAMIKRDVMADVLRGLTREQAESPEFLVELLRIIKRSAARVKPKTLFSPAVSMRCRASVMDFLIRYYGFDRKSEERLPPEAEELRGYLDRHRGLTARRQEWRKAAFSCLLFLGGSLLALTTQYYSRAEVLAGMIFAVLTAGLYCAVYLTAGRDRGHFAGAMLGCIAYMTGGTFLLTLAGPYMRSSEAPMAMYAGLGLWCMVYPAAHIIGRLAAAYRNKRQKPRR